MKFTIDPRILEQFPQTVIGVVVFQDIENKGEIQEIRAALKAQEVMLSFRFQGVVVAEHPHISAWREAYRQFGAKPKDYPSSIENLVRRVLKGSPVPNINAVVDIYNLQSLKHIVPVGGEDLDQIVGDIQLTFAGESEAPVKLLGEPEMRAPKPGEVIYKDDIGAICRRWNWKEADRTKFTLGTKNGILVIEALPPVGEELLSKALEELAALVELHCGGTIRTAILSKSKPIYVVL